MEKLRENKSRKAKVTNQSGRLKMRLDGLLVIVRSKMTNYPTGMIGLQIDPLIMILSPEVKFTSVTCD